MTDYPCPVCGELHDEAPWDGDGRNASFAICSCGIQFGYADVAGGDLKKRQRLYSLWREIWIKNGRNALSEDQQMDVIQRALNT